MIEVDDSFLCPRRAYEVRRFHTWPVIHQQTVGEHSAQVWRILRAIWPECPPHVLDHAMTHDIGELLTGDVPYPTKKVSPQLAAQLEGLEKVAHWSMTNKWQFPAPSRLTEFEHQVFKLAEYIEMFEYSLSERQLGNYNANLISLRMRQAVAAGLDLIKETEQHERALVYLSARAQYFQQTIMTDQEG